MKRTMITKLTAIACALAFGCGLLAGCANTGASESESEQQAGRAYMSQVNEIMVELDEELESFVDAVSRDDVVNMRTQADNAYQALDKLEALEAPETYEDVQEQYEGGTAKLREALDDYIALYSDMSGASFDMSTYEERIGTIQKLYDEGVALMEEGDETAAGKN